MIPCMLRLPTYIAQKKIADRYQCLVELRLANKLELCKGQLEESYQKMAGFLTEIQMDHLKPNDPKMHAFLGSFSVFCHTWCILSTPAVFRLFGVSGPV